MPITIVPAEVRAVLDLAADSGRLPDATIALNVFGPTALAEVKRVFPDADDADAEDALHLTNAAHYLTAALIAASWPHLTAERHGDDGYSRKIDGAEEIVARLRARASEELAMVQNMEPVEVDDESRPTMFALGSGTRGL